MSKASTCYYNPHGVGKALKVSHLWRFLARKRWRQLRLQQIKPGSNKYAPTVLTTQLGEQGMYMSCVKVCVSQIR